MYDTETVEVTQEVQVVSNPRCDRCKAPLEFVFGLNARQFSGALQVGLSGYYGGYIDMSDSSHDLCSDCARALYHWLGVPDPTDPANWNDA